jgi:hypothetical protein
MATRLLTVTLEGKYYQGSIPVRKITYSNSSVDLTEEEYQEIFSQIPSYWNTENDKLIRFIVFDDKSYFCEREKNVFNYSTREKEPKIYKFDYATDEEAHALYNFFVEKYAKIKISRTENLYDSIMNQIKDMSFVKLSMLEARNKLLQQTDYLMMSDYPLDEEDRQNWSVYRQELRDLTNQEAWINNNIMEVEMPVSPRPLDQLDVLRSSVRDLSSIPSDLTQELIQNVSENSVEDIIKNIAQISVKFELLKSISKLRLPILEFNNTEVFAAEQDYETFLNEVKYDTIQESSLPQNWWEAAISNIDDKISQVNAMLKTYKVDFTINDILNSIIEQNKVSEQDMEVNNILEELL